MSCNHALASTKMCDHIGASSTPSTPQKGIPAVPASEAPHHQEPAQQPLSPAAPLQLDVERVRGLIADDFDIYHEYVKQLLAEHEKSFLEQLDRRLAQQQHRADMPVHGEDVEARGDLCLLYMAHLEHQVASLQSALKDKDTLIEQISEVKLDASKRIEAVENDLHRANRCLSAANEHVTELADSLKREKHEHAMTKLNGKNQEELDRCELGYLSVLNEGLEKQIVELRQKLSQEMERRVRAETMGQVLEDALEIQLVGTLQQEQASINPGSISVPSGVSECKTEMKAGRNAWETIQEEWAQKHAQLQMEIAGLTEKFLETKNASGTQELLADAFQRSKDSSALEADNQALRETVSAQKSENKELLEKLHCTLEEVRGRDGEIKRLELFLADAQDRLQKTNEQFRTQQQEIAHFTDKPNEGLSAEEHWNVPTQVRRLQQDKWALEMKAEQLEIESDLRQKQLQQFRDENTSLRSHCACVEKNCQQKWEGQTSRLVAETKLASDLIEKLRQELKDISADKRQFETFSKEMAAENVALKAERTDLEAELEEVCAGLEKVSANASALEQKLERCRDVIEEKMRWKQDQGSTKVQSLVEHVVSVEHEPPAPIVAQRLEFSTDSGDDSALLSPRTGTSTARPNVHGTPLQLDFDHVATPPRSVIFDTAKLAVDKQNAAELNNTDHSPGEVSDASSSDSSPFPLSLARARMNMLSPIKMRGAESVTPKRTGQGKSRGKKKSNK